MRPQQSFGGSWTEEKLERVRKYLGAYTVIFDRNPAAMYLNTIYVDAFAGTGYRAAKSHGAELFPELQESDAEGLLKGSATIALEVQPSFDKFLFIERSHSRFQELERLKATYPEHASKIEIVHADANQFLRDWCPTVNWNKWRAVLFLDPFGMELDWTALETIANTRAIDTWLLFPIGMGVNRLLTRSEPPPNEWATSLTRIFGTDEWLKEFYASTLFDEYVVKDTDWERIAGFFVRRLQTIFSGVAENPLLLRNSNNAPLFLLCFATGAQSPSARRAALNIAQDILKR